jgi:hypothetical protein
MAETTLTVFFLTRLVRRFVPWVKGETDSGTFGFSRTGENCYP